MAFSFEGNSFEPATGTATFRYRFDDGRSFAESVIFGAHEGYDQRVLDRALKLAGYIIGVSYFKTFPTQEVILPGIDAWQANFLNSVYQEGLGQFAFENGLSRRDLAHFSESGVPEAPVPYTGQGILSLQSGGKDSLLIATMLQEKGVRFTPWYVSSTQQHPTVLDEFPEPLQIAIRHIDKEELARAHEDGALNGHVPVTYIIQSLALIEAVLENKNTILVAIAHEGEEPHGYIGDMPVTHQWSKTWRAEQAFAEYVKRYVSPDIMIGSPLRKNTELKVAQLFVDHAWARFGKKFSSCNRSNYLQGLDNSELHWCGECSKCANSFLLFAPYVDHAELQSLFSGKNLFTDKGLEETFKGLLGIDGVMKPFECIGEIDELRHAYHLAVSHGYEGLGFDVPESHFDAEATYPLQPALDLLR